MAYYKNKINALFAITNFIDTARWDSDENYNLINFYSDSLSNDEKLLTHWLCYITDRQMPFRRIWDIGGFILSEIVHKIREKKDMAILDPANIKNSYFIKAKDYSLKDRSSLKNKGKNAHLFVSHTKIKKNNRLIDYGFKENSLPYFMSRYYPSDYKSIICTLTILKDYDYSIIKFIIFIANKYINDSRFISKLLFSLY
ncbi:MAG: hypothetical protein DRP51_09840, partial [Candidatus Zixiibacteriota bacterium]